MAPPAIVGRLVERFDSRRQASRSGQYSQAQLREEFLNPFFEALGWDVYNRKGCAERCREVIQEGATNPSGHTRAPAYCFRAGGVRRFFVEAKKPSADIREAVSPAYQLRRYAWSAKLPVSIVTDFAEWAVYDCRIRPVKTDRASSARIMYHTYTEYVDCWDKLAGLFSPEAIRRGALDELVASKKVKRGTAEVDDAFLDEIQQWREALARNITQRNPELSQRDLNLAVQRTVDRIVFLRMCEDRGIEPHGALQSLLNGPDIYRRLGAVFQKADRRYNSGLFYFSREDGRADTHDELTLGLSIDDEVLREILGGLSYPDSPYEFSVFPAEILGQVYEQFLGKEIRLTAGRRAVVEQKPEVKKAGGVYYTPTYIVDYIVRHAVGKLLEGGGRGTATGGKRKAEIGKPMAPREAAKLRILDPACGAGSFLIGAYQYLLDWHRDWYETDDPEKHARGRNPKLYRGPAGQWRLTAAERKRILLNNVYGVDIDPHAVEVTKLSLLLKVLEGESQETLSTQLRLFHERALPSLAGNLKCGNSLIGPDFFCNRQMSLPDDEDARRINAFDWKAEFPRIFEGNGGFDAVIGNPPYRRELGCKDLLDEIAATGFGRRYRCPRMDLWHYFAHRGLELLKPGGVLSFIVNAYWVSGTGARKLIAALRDRAHVDEVFLLGKLKVFENVSGQHMIMRVTNNPGERPATVKLARPRSETTARPFVVGDSSVLEFERTPRQLFRGNRLDLQPPSDGVLSKLERCGPLSDLGAVRQGIAENPASINKRTNEKHANRWRIGEGVFALRPEEAERLGLSREEKRLLRPYYDLCDVGRYSLATDPSLVLIYSTRETCPDLSAYPRIRRHLIRFRAIMQNRRETRRGANRWWHLHWPRDERLWQSSKILSVQMAARPSFVRADGPAYVPFSVNVFLPAEDTSEELDYICGVLNSRALWKWYQHNAKRRGVGLEINGSVLARTPIRRINFADPEDGARHDRLAGLAGRMLSLHGRLKAAKASRRKTGIRRQIDAADRQIDRLVYELYGLTEKEIAIVEEATP